MWVVIHIAQGAETAAHIQALLDAEGFPVKLREIYKNVPREQNFFEVRVLASEAEEARDVLAGKKL